MYTITDTIPLYGCVRITWLGGILVREMAASLLDAHPAADGHHLERSFTIVFAVHAWGLLCKILFHCDNKSVVDIWD